MNVIVADDAVPLDVSPEYHRSDALDPVSEVGITDQEEGEKRVRGVGVVVNVQFAGSP